MTIAERIFQDTMTGFRAHKQNIDDKYILMMVKDSKEYEFYLKKYYEETETPYLYMFSLPIEQQSAREALDEAIAVAPDYEFLFDDPPVTTLYTVPIFHKSLLLHECTNCGCTISADQKFCPECGDRILWEHEVISN